MYDHPLAFCHLVCREDHSGQNVSCIRTPCLRSCAKAQTMHSNSGRSPFVWLRNVTADRTVRAKYSPTIRSSELIPHAEMSLGTWMVREDEMGAPMETRAAIPAPAFSPRKAGRRSRSVSELGLCSPMLELSRQALRKSDRVSGLYRVIASARPKVEGQLQLESGLF